ncbi:MAG: hypothetical protein KY475_11460 [Planctomycetes bacterium]|nr:hypothetical protein [Planctomycetota bacterium]
MAADKAAVEQQIRYILATGTDAMTLSDQLFSPNGLFNQIATNEAERRQVARSPLFKEAQRRLSDLQRQEADEFARNIRDLRTTSESKRLVKMERL